MAALESLKSNQVVVVPSEQTDKTLILSDGEYKRYEEGSPVIVSDENVIPVMTSNNTPSGVASASNIYNSTYDAWRAFTGTNIDFQDAWVTYTGITQGWLQYDFGYPIGIGKYTITSRNNATRGDLKSWTFEGSNDGFINEVHILDGKSDQPTWISNEKREFVFSNEMEFRYYRVNISEIYGANLMSIGELEMYEVSTPATPSSWQTVSSTLPSSHQFQEEGMEDLTIFDRQVQPVLNSPIQMTNEGVLGEGKVFKGKVDLKKYFDLRKLEIK